MEISKHYFVIGIDVGGTNTDAVIMQYPEKIIVSHTKTFTTRNISIGVFNAIQKVLNQQSKVQESDILAVMLGTTTFINAIIQTSNELSPVTVVRLCNPATKCFPPFCNFPEKLKEKIEQKSYYCNGGFEYNKETISDMNEIELQTVANELIHFYQSNKLSIINLVITGVFSSLSNDQEEKASKIFEQNFQAAKINYSITLSHKISQIGLLEREGAAILNACLIPLAQRAIPGLKDALIQLNLTNAELFLTSNQGTIISSERAQKFPIFTLASGPVNSLRGASFLTKLQDAIVCDIGGTTTDLATIQKGFPRPCSAYVSVAGVRTNFRMTDTVSFGLGGGSLVKFENNEVIIGPQSVGYKLKQEAISFGGEVLTTTDIALSLGFVKIEGTDPKKVQLTQEQTQKVIDKIISQIELYVDQMKTSQKSIDLILVGGGSILIPENVTIEGVSSIIRPQYFDVANAVGAANIQVEGIIDTIIELDKGKKEQLIEGVQKQAKELAIINGAIPNTIDYDLENIDLSYLPGNTTRVIVKAIGDLDISKLSKEKKQTPGKQINQMLLDEKADPFIEDFSSRTDSFNQIKIQDPKIVTVNGRKEWHLSEFDADCIAIGAGILGSGGGGSPYHGNLQLKFALRSGQTVRVISPDDMNKDEYVQIVAYYGAPLIFIEKVSGGEGIEFAMEAMQENLKSSGKKVGILASAEIGGGNSIIPLVIGGKHGFPVIDGDFMGRAFPELQMCTCFMYDVMKCYPIALSDEKNNCFILNHSQFENNKKVEQFLRKFVMEIGCMGGIAMQAMSKEQIDKSLVKYSLSRCWRLGREILIARKNKVNPLSAIEKQENGKLVFQGKITVDRSTKEGFNIGTIQICGINNYKNQTLFIDFQNENLIARLKLQNEPKDIILASVPDLICLVNLETFDPICTEDLKHGLRINCLIIPCDPLLKTSQALNICGPRQFGYKIDYKEFANISDRRSIIHEFN